MPTDTIDADSVAFATTSALTGEPIASMNVGYYVGVTYASAIRFVLPSITSINSATLKVYNPANSAGGTLVTSLSVRTSAQTLPTAPIGSQWTPFGSEVSITSPTAEIDVTTLLQAALAAEVIEGAVCFIWLDDGSDDGLLQFDGIDPSLDPFNFPPQLLLNYDEEPSGFEGELDQTLDDTILIATGTDAALAVLDRTLDQTTLEAEAGSAVAAQLDVTLLPTVLAAAGGAVLLAQLDRTLDPVSLEAVGHVGNAIEGSLDITLSPTILEATGSNRVSAALDRTLDATTLSATGVVGPARRGRQLFPQSLFPNSLFVG